MHTQWGLTIEKKYEKRKENTIFKNRAEKKSFSLIAC